MTIRKIDDFPNIDIKPVADERKLISECNVRVAKGIFSQLYKFRCPGGCGYTCAADKHLVKALRPPGTPGSYAPDAAVVVNEFGQNPARQNTFGAISNGNAGFVFPVDVDMQIRAALRYPLCDPFGRSDRR